MALTFYSNAEFFERFFRRCMVENLDTEEDRVKLLLTMAQEEKGKCSIGMTNRSKKEIVQDLAKNYGNVLDYTQKGD